MTSRNPLYCFTLSALVGLAGLFGLSGSVQAEGLKIQADKSAVTVTFRQMNVPVDAKFNKVDIYAEFDPAAPEQAKAMILIDTASFDFGPGAEEYNEEVRAPDWFDTRKFPTATFEGLRAKSTGENRFNVVGKLTIKGISQDVVAPFELNKQAQTWVLKGQLPISRLAFKVGEGDWKDTSIVEDEVIVKFQIVTAAP